MANMPRNRGENSKIVPLGAPHSETYGDSLLAVYNRAEPRHSPRIGGLAKLSGSQRLSDSRVIDERGMKR